MADDAYYAYQKAVLKYKNYDFTLSGYYGGGNIGDDTLLFSIISNILQKKHDLKICLLTKKPKKSQKWLGAYFANVTAKQSFNFFSVRKAVKKSKALVFGGGSLLQDSTSARSFMYYSWLLRYAQKLGKKTVLYANGIGPLYAEKSKKQTEKIIKNITLATIRDEESYNCLTGVGACKEKIYLTADEALTVKQNKYIDPYKRAFKNFIKNNYIVVCVRKWRGLGSEFFSQFAAAVEVICREYNLTPVYIAMEPNDKGISAHLASLNGRAYLAEAGGDIEKTLAVVRSAEAVISMRLHMHVFAAAFGVPMIGVSYDPKIDGFLNSIFGDGRYTIGLNDFSKDRLAEKFNLIMADNKNGALKAQIAESAEKLREKAELNAVLFMEAMEFDE
jgi:polysaccharide pyruvyl transferase CsaB